MPSIINASNSTGLTFTSDQSGVLQLQNNGVNLPALSVAPAFSAFQSSAQTISSTTFTKITFTTEVFDTNSNFASSTFTPTVAGYYQATSAIYYGASTNSQLYFFKNGSLYQGSQYAVQQGAFISGLVYLNGSTDYLETYVYLAVGRTLTVGSGDTYFQAAMVRGE